MTIFRQQYIHCNLNEVNMEYDRELMHKYHRLECCKTYITYGNYAAKKQKTIHILTLTNTNRYKVSTEIQLLLKINQCKVKVCVDNT